MLTILRDFYPTLVPLALPQAPKVRLEIVVQVCLHGFFFVKSTVCLLFIYFSGLAASKEAATAAVATTSTTKPVTDLGEIEVASSASATVLNSNSNGMY